MSLKIKVGEVEMTVEEARKVFSDLQQLFGVSSHQKPSPLRESSEIAELRRRVEALERRGAVIGPPAWPKEHIRYNEVTCGVAAGAAGHLTQNQAARQGEA